MITAVDTNVLLDVFGADPEFGQRSAEALRACLREGRLVACEVVWAETAGFFPSSAAAQEAMERLAVGFSPLDVKAALAAGGAWRKHCAKGGRRERVAADFPIGAHAQVACAASAPLRSRLRIGAWPRILHFLCRAPLVEIPAN